MIWKATVEASTDEVGLHQMVMQFPYLIILALCSGCSELPDNKVYHHPAETGTLDSNPSDSALSDGETADSDSAGHRPETAEAGDTSGLDSADNQEPETGDSSAALDTGLDLGDADAKLLGEGAMENAGMNVSRAGDANGDGYDDLAISAPRAADGSGAVYLVQGPVEGTESLMEAEGRFDISGIDGMGMSTYAGSVAGGGDIDGDGLSDLLVGTPFSGGEGEGWTWVLLGPAEGDLDLLDAQASMVGSSEGESAGASVAWAGDVDGDGWEDVLVGAPGVMGSSDESMVGHCADDDWDEYGYEYGYGTGAAYLMRGPLSGSVSLESAAARLEGEDGGDTAGNAVVGNHDFDGDGQLDLLVGADNNCEGGVDAGAAYVVLGPVSGEGMLVDADAKLVGRYHDDEAGAPLDVADTNGDGTPDLLVAAPDRDTLRGEIYIMLGPASGTEKLKYADAIFTGENSGDYAGTSISNAGDQNSDGVEDLVIGAPFADTPSSDYGGVVYLIYGPVTGTMDLSDADGRFLDVDGSAGKAVANLGDVDGDGFADLLVGAYRDGEAAEGAGAAYLLLGSGTLLSSARPSD